MIKFNWDADDYSNYSSQQQKWGRELISKLNLKESESVLDIGCGDGKVTADISLMVPNGFVIGVDNSVPMIQLAKKNFSGGKYSNLSFQICDARELDFNNQFDVVFSNAVLHWVDDHLKVLKGIYKSLKPGGRILLQFGGQGNAQNILLMFDELIRDNRWHSYFKDFKFPYNFPEENEYKELVLKSGLAPVRVELVKKDMIHECEKKLVGWIRTTWLPYTSRVPENRREELINGIIKKYIEKFPPDGNGRIHLEMVRLEAEAVKK